MRIIQRYGAQKKTHSLRNVLVVTQFAISSCSLWPPSWYNGMQFMKRFDLGIDQSQVLVIPVTGKRCHCQY